MMKIKGQWKWNDILLQLPNLSCSVNFTSDGANYDSICVSVVGLEYYNGDYVTLVAANWEWDSSDTICFDKPEFRIMDFGATEQEIDDDFYNYLVANAKPQLSIAEKLTQIAENERKVYNAGYEKGKSEGGSDSYYDEIWDAIQNNGDRTNYSNAFAGTRWDEPFNPKYSFENVINAEYIFNYAKAGDNLYTDKLDFSKCARTLAAFMSSDVTRLKRIDMRSCSAAYNGAASTFLGCTSLYEISEFYPPVIGFSGTFTSCSALRTINFCSELAVNGLVLQDSKNLSHDSLMSIINALKDYSEDTSGTAWKITIGSTNLEKLTDAELGIAWDKGWEVV